jgi:hypothetical protein
MKDILSVCNLFLTDRVPIRVIYSLILFLSCHSQYLGTNDSRSARDV